MKKLLCCFALLACLSGNLAAQNLIPLGTFGLNLDYARFRNDAQSSYFELYYGFYPNSLNYTFAGGKYTAAIKVHTKLTRNTDQTAVVNRPMLLPIVISDTASAAYKFPFTTQTGFVVPYGEYTLEVTAVDSLAPARRDSLRLTISLLPYAEKMTVSDIQICSRVQASNKKDDLFYKNGLEVVPNPALVFGVATHPMLFNYAELYNLDPEATYTVKNQIVSAEGQTVKETTRAPRKYGVKNGIEAGSINVTAVMPGKYIYRLLVFDDRAQELARSEKIFFVYNPHLKPPATTPLTSSFASAELSGLTAAELDAEFQQAKYLARSDEIKMYAQIQTEGGKREFLADFWSKVESGRLDRPPMKRVEYLRRVAAANQQYKAFSKDGWRTDRGRIFILYGEPDHVARATGDAATRPYVTWVYYGIEKGVEFVFVDRYGSSDYQLVHSTKRGELQDEDWERYLK